MTLLAQAFDLGIGDQITLPSKDGTTEFMMTIAAIIRTSSRELEIEFAEVDDARAPLSLSLTFEDEVHLI